MLKLFIKTITYIISIILISVIALFYSIDNEKKSIDFTIGLITSVLSSGDYKIDIGSIYISRDKNNLKLSILKLISSKESNYLNIPELNIDIDIGSLISRRSFLSVDSRDIEYKTKYTKKVTEDNKNTLNRFRSIFLFHDINIQNINMEIDKSDQKYNLNIDHAYFKLDSNNIKSDILLDLDGEKSIIKLESTIDNNIVKNELFSNNIPSYLITDLFSDNIKKDDIYIIFNGEFRFDYDLISKKINGKIINDNSFGFISHDHKFEIPECIINIDNDQLNFDKFRILFSNNSEIKIDSKLKYKNNYKYIDHIDLDIDINNIEVNDLEFLWPNILFKNIRKWIIENIKDGSIKSAKGHFNFAIDDIKSSPLPNDIIDIAIDFENVNLNYYQNLPKLKKISGTTIITGNSLTTDIKKGKIVDSNIKSANITIPFNNNPIKINGIIMGSARDIIDFIPKDNLSAAKDENIFLENIKGNALTDINIEIPINSNSDDKLKLSVKSKLSNIDLDNLINNFTLSNANLDVIFDGKKINVKGNGLLSNNNIIIDWTKYLYVTSEFDSKTILNIDLSPESLRSIYKNSNFNQGSIKLDTIITSKNNKQIIDLNIIADNALLNIAEIGYNKPINHSLRAHIDALYSDNILKLNNINILGEDIDIKGNAQINRKSNSIIDLNLPVIKFNNNDLSISYKNANNHIDIVANGKSLDLNKSKFNNLFRSDSSKNGTRSILLNIDNIVLKNDHHIRNLKSKINCSETSCNDIDINADIGLENIISIKSKKIDDDNTEFIIRTKNISDILQSFDLYQNMKGGELKVKLNKNNKSSNFTGRAKLKNFVAVKTPILSKLFTFTSLPKIIELPFAFLPGEKLSNNDIPFTNLISNFEYKNNILHINDATIEGPQIGLTTNGIVDFKQKTINMSGNVIPELLGISKVINNIPLLGNIIQGGKNKGLVAASYSVKGKFGDIHTFVNPLSILTPGFMRNMFDIFEHNRKSIDDDVAD